jgi:hypothetical protein
MKKQISFTAETIADLPNTDDGRMRDRLPVVIHIGHFDHVGVVEKHA